MAPALQREKLALTCLRRELAAGMDTQIPLSAGRATSLGQQGTSKKHKKWHFIIEASAFYHYASFSPVLLV
jgi:hypothetical protein